MPIIQNLNTIKELQAAAYLTFQDTPRELGRTIVPVLPINPCANRKLDIVNPAASSTTGSLTLYTTPMDKDFYLVGIQWSIMKDATNDNTSATIAANVGGASKTLFYMTSLTTTARDDSGFVSFQRPIKIDRGATILFTTSFTVGALTRSAVIYGYTLEPFESV